MERVAVYEEGGDCMMDIDKIIKAIKCRNGIDDTELEYLKPEGFHKGIM